MDAMGLKKQLGSLTQNSSLHEIQEYTNQMIKTRGFDHETPQDIMILLMEEVGELAKEIRKSSHMKVDVTQGREVDIEGEIADVFNYLLALCRIKDIDLFKAFKQKEEINSNRTWE